MCACACVCVRVCARACPPTTTTTHTHQLTTLLAWLNSLLRTFSTDSTPLNPSTTRRHLLAAYASATPLLGSALGMLASATAETDLVSDSSRTNVCAQDCAVWVTTWRSAYACLSCRSSSGIVRAWWMADDTSATFHGFSSSAAAPSD